MVWCVCFIENHENKVLNVWLHFRKVEFLDEDLKTGSDDDFLSRKREKPETVFHIQTVQIPTTQTFNHIPLPGTRATTDQQRIRKMRARKEFSSPSTGERMGGYITWLNLLTTKRCK